jgi:hypothetical protein
MASSICCPEDYEKAHIYSKPAAIIVLHHIPFITEIRTRIRSELKGFLEVEWLSLRSLKVWKPKKEAKKILLLKKLGSSESGSGYESGYRVLMTKNLRKKIEAEQFLNFFTFNLLILGPHKGRLSYRGLKPSKENI